MKFLNPHDILDGYASLKRHHDAKAKERQDQLDYIHLENNAKVLDIGVGPGLYLAYWLKATADRNVHFDLFDISKDALDISIQETRSVHSEDRVTLLHGDFMRLKTLSEKSYDAIFIGNTIEYLENPILFITDTVLPLLKSGGRLAVRDLDCSFMSCSKASANLNQKIIFSRFRNNEENSLIPGNYQNPFIGKSLESILKSSGLHIEYVVPYFFDWKYPFTNEQIEYLSHLHTTWYIEDTLGILTKSEKEQWFKLFSKNDATSIFNFSDSNYLEAEFLVIGIKK